MSDTPPTDREAQLRDQANRWSRSETGWERRAGESLSAALLILDGQRDIDAWLAREVHRLRAEVVELTTELTRLRARVKELEQMVLERYAKHVIRSWVEKVAAEFVRRAEDESEREDQSESPYYSREHHGRCEAFREAANFITEHTANLRGEGGDDRPVNPVSGEHRNT